MRTRRAFSLIELLVVVTIIGTVIAILLPSLSSVQEQARRTKCLAQLQQLGEAFHVYANNSKDWLPVMPVPPGQTVIENQWIYGGLSGLFSLRQIGDGSTGYGAGSQTGLPYSNGNPEPLMASYIGSFAVLRCPADREDRFYGDPYSPTGNTSYAAALPKVPYTPARAEDVVSYNVSYAYIAGYRLSQSADLIGDETNGPDLGPFAGYGQPNTPPGTPTPNSTAAGAAVPGSFAPSDNHKQHGGNVVGTSGSGRWTKQWWAPPRRPSDPPITFID